MFFLNQLKNFFNLLMNSIYEREKLMIEETGRVTDYHYKNRY